MRTRIQITSSFIVLFFATCVLLLCSGCGGGSKGTGGFSIEGRVLRLNGSPVAGARITELGTGSTDTSDTEGMYLVTADSETTIRNAEFSLAVDVGSFSDTIVVMQVTDTATSAQVNIRIDEDDESAEADEVNFYEDEDDEESHSGGNSSNSGGSNSSDDGEDDSNEINNPSGGSGNHGSGGDDDSEDDNSDSSGDSGSQDDSGEDVDIEGYLGTVTSTTLVVNGLLFFYDANTTFIGLDGQPTTLSTFVIGDRVEVIGYATQTSVFATRVELKSDSSDSGGGDDEGGYNPGDDGGGDDHEGHHSSGEDVEAEGHIQNITSTTIRVDGTDFLITEETSFLDEDGHQASPSSFEVGDEVHVTGQEVDGVATAQVVRKSD